MLKQLSKIIDKGPSFNKYVIEGMAYGELRDHSVAYIDGILSSIIVGVDDVNYMGISELSVDDEVQSNLNPNLKTKKDYDVSITFRRKYKIHIEYKGEEIQGVYLYIPFCIEKGIIISSGARYQILPVITDSVITVNEKYIFLRPRKDKLFIHTDTHAYVKNDIIVYGNVDHSDRLYKNKKEVGKVGNVLTPIATYIFVKYGFKSLFNNLNLRFSTDYAEMFKLANTHDIYASTGKLPSGRISKGYESSKLIVAVEKGKLDQLELNMLTTLFYVTDVFPHSVDDIVEIMENDDKINEEEYWKHIISRFIFRDTVDTHVGIEAISQHIKGLEYYLDTVIIAKLKEVGYNVNDFFDLLKLISRDGVNMKLKHQKTDDNTPDRYLDILYYIMFPLIINTSKFTSQLGGLIRKKALTFETVSKAVKDTIGPRCLFNSFKTDAMSLAIMPLSSTLDWAAGDITNSLELQERGDGVIRNTSNTKFPKNKRHLIGGDIYLGNILHIPKDWPTPMAKLNPFAKLDMKTRRINPTEKEQWDLTYINRLLSGKISIKNNKVKEMIDE